jgi:hypothetical protein
MFGRLGNQLTQSLLRAYDAHKMPSNTDLSVTAPEPERNPWLQLSPAFSEAYKDRRPLSDSELVEALLRFANTADDTARAALRAGVRLDDSELAWFVRDIKVFESESEPLGTELKVRDALAMISAGDIPEPLLADWRRRASGLALAPTFERDGTRRYRFAEFARFADEPQPIIAYVLLLLLAQPFRWQLCRCKWGDCGRFFLSVQPKGRRGAPIRDYCPGTDHRERAHQAGAVERMRKSRERAKQRARTKQSRRHR